MQEFTISEETNLEGVRVIAEGFGIIRTRQCIRQWLDKGVLKGRKVAPRTFVICPQVVRLRAAGKPKKNKN